ncbi:hypothetical protein [Anatilimnocola floriformis]|uniref:hypothetical protein n=1 Tax=Anatilimnocola floriformis TaxID=2948575 RepID=UPI0020C48550|nr:hypothetical protein [Anatilimnocola floriformis]
MSTASSQNSTPWPKIAVGNAQVAASEQCFAPFDLTQVHAAVLALPTPTVSRLETVSDEALHQALLAAGELFPAAPPTIEVVCDAETQEYPFFGINVKWSGDARGMIAQEIAWARRVQHLFGPFQQPRLCVVAAE